MAALTYSTCDEPTGAWVAWNSTASTCDMRTAWGGWTTDRVDTTCSSSTGYATAVWVKWHEPKPETEEQKEKRLAAEEQYRQRRAAELASQAEARKVEEARAKAAAERAEGLLLATLSAEQAADYKKNRGITVRGSQGRLYRIWKGWSGNVEELGKDGKPVRKLCLHPKSVRTPDEDNVLLQKLMLETDEAEFRKIANLSPVVPSEQLREHDRQYEQQPAMAG